MQIIDRMSDISDRFDAVFCDVWGCIHNGVSYFADAIHALETYRKSGGIVLLLTNAPRPWQDVARQLAYLGVSTSSWDAILTSGDAAKTALFDGRIGTRVFHIGPERDVGFFEPPKELSEPNAVTRVDLEAASGIVCTGLFDDRVETPDDYRKILEQALTRNLPFLCANPDRIVDRGPNRIYCAGALADLYSALGGEVLLFGKPMAPIYDLALTRLSQLKSKPTPKNKILCIGDGISTDLEGAQRQALPSLFVTGGLAAQETGTETQPNAAHLKAFCRRHKLSPKYVIGHLR